MQNKGVLSKCQAWKKSSVSVNLDVAFSSEMFITMLCFHLGNRIWNKYTQIF